LASGKARQEGRKAMTSRELARLLGVSQSAVSRAFSPGASISPELRERILAYARQVDYHPNAIASILSRRRSNIVGIVISELQNPFYPMLLEKLSRELQIIGLQSLLFNVTPGSDVENQLAALRQYHVDAVVIISATALSGAALTWATEGRAAVLVNRVIPEGNLNAVSCNNMHGARAVADHFHAIGSRRVAYVSGLMHTSTAAERRSGFITRAAELGMTLVGQASRNVYSYDAGYECALELARLGQVDAIFFANDTLAAGGIDALRDVAGIRVPEDIAVAGFDDIAMARWPRYSLTTYRQPLDEIVRRTVMLLQDAYAGTDGEPATHLIDGELVVRASTGGGPKGDGAA
jgi:DNA-binding LacI/PurR family transcriptional regulator